MPKPVKTQRAVTEYSSHDFDKSPEEVLMACRYLVGHNDEYSKIVKLKKDMAKGEYEFRVIYGNKALSALSVKLFSSFDGTGSTWEYEANIPSSMVNGAIFRMSSPNIDKFIMQVEEILNSGIDLSGVPLEDEGKSKSGLKFIVVIFIIFLILYLLIRF